MKSTASVVGKDCDIRHMFANRPGLQSFNSRVEAGLSFSVLEYKKNKAKISEQPQTLWSLWYGYIPNACWACLCLLNWLSGLKELQGLSILNHRAERWPNLLENRCAYCLKTTLAFIYSYKRKSLTLSKENSKVKRMQELLWPRSLHRQHFRLAWRKLCFAVTGGLKRLLMMLSVETSLRSISSHLWPARSRVNLWIFNPIFFKSYSGFSLFVVKETFTSACWGRWGIDDNSEHGFLKFFAKAVPEAFLVVKQEQQLGAHTGKIH